MGANAGVPPIADVAAYLLLRRPDVADELRSSHPEIADLLMLGDFGGGDPPPEPAIRTELLRRAVTISGALSAARADARETLRVLKSKLTLARRIKFATALITLATSGGLLAQLLSPSGGGNVSIGMASIAFVCSALGLFADQLVLSGAGVERITDLVTQLSATSRSLDIIMATLSPEAVDDIGSASLETLIAEANTAFNSLIGILEQAEAL